MDRRWKIAAGMAMAGALWAPGAAAGVDTALFVLAPDAAPAVVQKALDAVGATQVRVFAKGRLVRADLPAAAWRGTQRSVRDLAVVPGVLSVERDARMLPAQSVAPDAVGTADCSSLWALEALDMQAVWAGLPSIGPLTGLGAPGIAVEDSGFLTAHEELVGQVRHQYDFGNQDGTAEVEPSAGIPAHGTFIGALIAGVANNGAGRAGLLPQGGLVLQKIANDDGALFVSYAVEAMGALVDENPHGVRVLNYSITTSSRSAAMETAVEMLGGADILLVGAAGNCSYPRCLTRNNDRRPLYPASFDMPHVLSVASSVESGALNSYSHVGQNSVDLAAPGKSLCSAGVDSTSDYYTASGTSYAAPLVAGAAALVMEAHPALSAPDVARVLRASATPHSTLQTTTRSGGGLNVVGALQAGVPRLSFGETGEHADHVSAAVTVDNDGAAATACVLIESDLAHAVTAVEHAGACLTLDTGAAGATLDAAGHPVPVRAGTNGAVACLSMPAHSTAPLTVRLSRTGVGETVLHARVRMTSAAGAAVLWAPAGGDVDAAPHVALPAGEALPGRDCGAGVLDAGMDADAGQDTDAGLDADAGQTGGDADAGRDADAGQTGGDADAGRDADAGQTGVDVDAGRDAGEAGPGAEGPSVASGCAQSGAGIAGWAVLAFAWALRRRSRV